MTSSFERPPCRDHVLLTRIVTEGYDPALRAFLPLYPGVVWLLRTLLGGTLPPQVIGCALSSLCLLVFAVGWWLLNRTAFGQAVQTVGGNDTATNGTSVAANYNVSNAIAQASLGRPLSLGAANTAVNMLLPGQLYGDRVNQVDMRFAKVLRFGRTRTLAQLLTDTRRLLADAWDTP